MSHHVSWLPRDLAFLDDRCPLPLTIPFTAAQALDLGVSRSRLSTLRHRGLVRQVLRGVFAAAQIPDTMRARNLTREQVMNDVLLAAQPTKRFVTVDEVASLALYLCSNGAASITGANLSMDGGWTAA